MARPNKYAKNKKVVSIRLTDFEKREILKENRTIQEFIEKCLEENYYKESMNE